MNETIEDTQPSTITAALPPDERPGPPQGPLRLGKVLARAAAVTAALTVAGSALGLVRDQTIAHLFGAGTDSDAFLIAWTVPEMASTLLIEEAMALVLVPAFSHALARRAAGDAPDPVRSLVRATLPRLFLLLTCTTGVLILGAPVVVELLAPGLADPQLAVGCTRLTSVTVLSFGLTGYLSAALRAHRSYLPPAVIYLAYNLGIIVTMLVLHSCWGVRAAAAGVAAGSVLMVLAQLPAFCRQVATASGCGGRSVRLRTACGRLPAGPGKHRGRPPYSARRPALLGFAVLAPVVLFTV